MASQAPLSAREQLYLNVVVLVGGSTVGVVLWRKSLKLGVAVLGPRRMRSTGAMSMAAWPRASV